MRIVIVSHQASLQSNIRLAEAAQARGREATIVDPLTITPCVGMEDTCLPPCDVVIPRVATIILDHSLEAVAAYGRRGTPCLNPAEAIAIAANKFSTLRVLEQRGLPVPRSCMPRNGEDLRRFIECVGGPPVVLKLLLGYGGGGVMLADTVDIAETLLNTWLDMHRCVIVQEALGPMGRDVRVMVVGDEVVGAIERVAMEGEFRSNVHAGAESHPFEPTAAMGAAAVAATRAVGLGVAGVDFLLPEAGPVITEVNACPGLKAFEEATEVDLASRIVAAAEELVDG
jgi:ribosomal protein S6--L-glutamate ligase